MILQVWIIDSQDFGYYLQQIISMSKRSNADTRTHAHVSVRDRKAEFAYYYYPVRASFMDMSKRAFPFGGKTHYTLNCNA